MRQTYIMLRQFFVVVVLLSVATTTITSVHGGDVTYDGRSLIIDGQRKILFSGSIHYPRSTPEMWPSLITKAKEGGIDVIDTYVFWNLHEPQPGQYDFSGRNDIVGFIKEVHAQGLYACLRIGPFIESEWAYGGLPFWLHDIPGIVFRSDNEPFKVHMQNFTTKIVTMFQAENLFASQGGPIVLSQIENEYGTLEEKYGEQGKAYVKWAADMAVGLQTGVPWVMCKQNDAPDPVINTCNGLFCGETFVGPNSPNKPSLWTENWTTHFEVFGEDAEPRTVEDIAFNVALFIIAKNGSFVNYYMYHGGTNFGRAASEFVKTSYYDQAPIDEYGLIRQPKWGHLKELHAAIKLCATRLLSGVRDTMPLGQWQLAYIFSGQSGGECAAFLVNNDPDNGVNVTFQNGSYDLPPQSISILPDCKDVAFNTAKVSTQSNARTMTKDKVFNGADMWQEFEEPIPNFDDMSLRSNTILEQMNTTKDTSDYLWYTFRHQQESPDTNVTLSAYSLGHVLHAFINGKAVGSAHGSYESQRFEFTCNIALNNGINNVSLLSAMVGLPDSGAHLERRGAGLRRVTIQVNQNNQAFTNYTWGYQVGFLGEKLQIYLDQESNKVPWRKFSSPGKSLTWYKTVFNAPLADVPTALDISSMGKGEAWVNGQSIGRYWPSYRSPSGSSQIWYHVPRSLIKPTGNSLVLLEEEGGNPLGISLDTVSISQVCSHVLSSNSAPVTLWIRHNWRAKRITKLRPRVQLNCPLKRTITRIVFASYGTPVGDCGNTFGVGKCHSRYSKAMVEKACLGKRGCSIPISNQYFGGDPCPDSPKSLMVVAECK